MNEIAVFAKHWRPGTVKTRLAASVGPQVAADVYFGCLRSTLARVAGFDCRRVLAFWPPSSREAFAELVTAEWELVEQVPGNLGARMQAHFARSLADGVRRAVLIGSDSPTLPVSYVCLAIDLLATHDVVLGPSTDGGYYLVGVSRLVPDMFQRIAWSTPTVLRDTMARVAEQRASLACLPEWYDVDTLDDLRRLETALASASDRDSPSAELLLSVRQALRCRKP